MLRFGRSARVAIAAFVAALALGGWHARSSSGQTGTSNTGDSVAVARPTQEGLAKTRAAAGETPAAKEVFVRPVPRGIDDLLAIQKRVQALVPKIIEATVAIRVGRAYGSGVVVSEDGYVLTAAHVCGSPGRRAVVVLPNGREVRAKTLGVYRTVDAGLVQIVEKGKWPHVEMGDSKSLKAGQWCLCAGHPGGYQKGRASVIRLGRVIINRKSVIQTDCPLIGGDSGGPLFDMQGKVIGINSRIGSSTSWNFHVPVSHYEKHWDRLAASEAWGGIPSPKNAVLGINGEDHEKGCKITGVTEGLPAQKAGLQVGDVITHLDGQPINGIGDLAEKLSRLNPGQTVEIDLIRNGRAMRLSAELAARQ